MIFQEENKNKEMQKFLKDGGVKYSGLKKEQLIQKVLEAKRSNTAKVTDEC